MCSLGRNCEVCAFNQPQKPHKKRAELDFSNDGSLTLGCDCKARTCRKQLATRGKPAAAEWNGPHV